MLADLGRLHLGVPVSRQRDGPPWGSLERALRTPRSAHSAGRWDASPGSAGSPCSFFSRPGDKPWGRGMPVSPRAYRAPMSTTSVSPQAPTLDGVGDEAMLGVLMDVVGAVGPSGVGRRGRRRGLDPVGGGVAPGRDDGRGGEVAAGGRGRRAAYVSQGLRSTADLLGGLGLTRGEARSQALTAAALGGCRRWRTGWPAASWVSVRRQSRHGRWRTFP